MSFTESELAAGIDSEHEIDEDWIESIDTELRDEFRDVSRKDKDFMSIWNRHSLSEQCISLDNTMQLLKSFVEAQWQKMRDSKLELQLAHHLLQMWETGLIDPASLSQIWTLLHDKFSSSKTMADDKPSSKTMSDDKPSSKTMSDDKPSSKTVTDDKPSSKRTMSDDKPSSTSDNIQRSKKKQKVQASSKVPLSVPRATVVIQKLPH